MTKLTKSVAARRLNVSRQTVYNFIKRGLLKTDEDGLITPEAICNLITTLQAADPEGELHFSSADPERPHPGVLTPSLHQSAAKLKGHMKDKYITSLEEQIVAQKRHIAGLEEQVESLKKELGRAEQRYFKKWEYSFRYNHSHTVKKSELTQDVITERDEKLALLKRLDRYITLLLELSPSGLLPSDIIAECQRQKEKIKAMYDTDRIRFLIKNKILPKRK